MGLWLLHFSPVMWFWFGLSWFGPRAWLLSQYGLRVHEYSSLMRTTHSHCLMDHNEGLETPPQAYGRVVIALHQPYKLFCLTIFHGLVTGPAIELFYGMSLLDYFSLAQITHSHGLMKHDKGLETPPQAYGLVVILL